MLLPYKLTVSMTRRPVMNPVIILFCVAIFGACIAGYVTLLDAAPFIFDGWSLTGLIGHQFLHGDLGHIVFNMMFLWVFGNAVCARLGGLRFLALYLACGMAAGVCHRLASDNPLIGASGAISGIMAFGLMVWPSAHVRSIYFGGLFGGTLTVRVFWMLLFWIGRDVYDGLFNTTTNVAHWAHVGGYVGGAVIALVMLAMGKVPREEDEEPTLWDYLRPRQSTGGGPEASVATAREMLAPDLSFSSPDWIRWTVGLTLIVSYPLMFRYGNFNAPFLALIGVIQIAPFIAEWFGNMAGGILYRRQEGKPQPIYGIPERLAGLGRFEEAEQEYEKIMEEFPDEVKPHTALIEIALKRLRNVEAAEALYQRGMQTLKSEKRRAELTVAYRNQQILFRARR